MNKCLTSGLAILLPLIFTLMIVNFFINFLTKPFLEPATAFLTQWSFFSPTWVLIPSKALILLILFALTVLIGFLGKLFLVNYLFHFGDYLFLRLPLVNKIYKTCQDVIHTLFSSSSKSFSQVVLIPFPNSSRLSVGLVTNESIKIQSDFQSFDELVSVFVPGAINPSFGFLVMFKREQLTFVNMKVDEAMKFLVSCGVVKPNFQSNSGDECESYFLSREEQLKQNSLDLP